jgi:hypothetical protein
MEKIYITGTGRCGTTFLIKLFTFLNFDTGYTKKNYVNDISTNCNSGMEKLYNHKPYIIKNPRIINNISKIIEDKQIKIKTVIIPIRDYKLSAVSRVKHGNDNGGLWNANNENTQLLFYNEIIANYIYYMVKYEINTIFIDFDKMISDKLYLFDKLKNILDEKDISFDLFSSIYDEVSITARPK